MYLVFSFPNWSFFFLSLLLSDDSIRVECFIGRKMFFFLIVFSYEFASPVIQYEFECFRKTDSVFFLAFLRRVPNIVFSYSLLAISYTGLKCYRIDWLSHVRFHLAEKEGPA